MGKKIFVSYARGDRPRVEQLVADLRGSGHSPFFDEELAGGQDWWEALLTQIEGCDAFMPALTQRYLRSVPCKLEAEYATALDKPFLPIALEAISPRFCAPRIATAHWVTYDPAERGTILDLMRALNSMAEAPSLPAAMPQRPQAPVSYLTDLKGKIDSPADLPMQEQVLLLSALRPRIDGDEAEDVHALLTQLRARSDITIRVASEIDALLAGAPPPQRDLQAAPAGGPPQQPGGGPPSYAAASSHVPPPPPHSTAGPAPAPGGQYTAAPNQPPPPGYQPPPPGYQQGSPHAAKPGNFLVANIIVALLSCFGAPFAIVGIVYSAQVNSKFAAGDVHGATVASKRAKTWLIVAIVAAASIWLLVFVAGALGGTGSDSNF